ncbi:MAG TPA: citrate/2-methylcitrate synthase [Acidimicrobiales bacterium]
MAPGDEWLTSEAAAARLGVKPETLYAYVSRGAVRSERVPGSRRSRFLRADVEQLASRQRAGGRAGGLEVLVQTDLTLLDPTGHLYYRGWDVADAVARGATFEEVAHWLWTGERAHPAFEAPPEMLAVADRVAGSLADQPVTDRLRAVVAAVRHTDPLRDDRRPAAVALAAQGLITTLVRTVPVAHGQRDAPPGASIARQLWPRLSARRATGEAVRLLDAALVLLADHELAASTLAARVAASTWADPYLVVLAGMAALGGPLHGGASRAARQLIGEVTGAAGPGSAVSPARAIGDRLRDEQAVPGFGHRVYLGVDPRAEVLLGLLDPEPRPDAPATALVATVRQRGLAFPNVDFALAALGARYDMIDDAGELIFTIARVAGWLAHATEEYRYRLRFRTRAVYTGLPPG